VLVPLVLLWGLDGAILSIAAELIVGLIVTAFMIRSLAPPQPKAAPTTGLDDRATLKLLMNFGGATVIAAVVGRLMTLWIRRRTIEHIGLDGTGLFQVAYGICQQYVAIVLGAMGAYALPTYRRLMSDRPALIGEMNSTLRGTLLFIVPALIGLMLFRDILIRLLYSEAFAGASDMLQIQLVGDLFKGFSWSIGLIMLASGRMWWHVLADVSFWLIAVVTMEAIALSSPHVAPSLGLTIGHVCLAVISYSVARRAVGFTLGARNRRLCGASVLAVAAAFIGASVGGWVSVVASTAALVVWLRLAVERSELRGLLVWLTPRARSVLAPLGLGGALDAIVGRLTTLLADPAAHDDAGEP
jgi:O-antigen/teichoic acid export membrane protein